MGRGNAVKSLGRSPSSAVLWIKPRHLRRGPQDHTTWPGLINSGASAYKNSRISKVTHKHWLLKYRPSNSFLSGNPPPHSLTLPHPHSNRIFTVWIGFTAIHAHAMFPHNNNELRSRFFFASKEWTNHHHSSLPIVYTLLNVSHGKTLDLSVANSLHTQYLWVVAV